MTATEMMKDISDAVFAFVPKNKRSAALIALNRVYFHLEQRERDEALAAYNQEQAAKQETA